MNLSLKCMAAFSCAFVLSGSWIQPFETSVQAKTALEDKHPSQKNEQEVLFNVFKDQTTETSVMDGYMRHPAVLMTDGDQQKLRFTLTHPEWWKTFEIYDGNQPLKLKTIKETKEERIVEVAVQPGMKVLDSKVHIVVPDINYNHQYKTQITLDTPIPKVESKQAKKSMPIIKEVKERQQNQTTSKSDEKPEMKIYQETVEPKHQQQTQLKNESNESFQLDYQVYKNNTSEPSVMDQYMEHPAQIIKNGSDLYVQFTLKNASWWKSFSILDKDEVLQMQVVKEDKTSDIRVVQFKVPPSTDLLTSKVHIVVPELNYDNYYTTQIKFAAPITTNMDTVNQTIFKHVVKHPSDLETEGSHFTQSKAVLKSTDTKEIKAQPETKPSLLQKDNKTASTTSLVEPLSKASKINTVAIHPIVKASSNPEVPLPDVVPKFDRNADQSNAFQTKVPQPVTGSIESNRNNIYLGIIIFLSLLLLGGSILYVRKGENIRDE